MPIEERIHEIQTRIAAACARAGRNPADVTLVAVSKTRPVEDILAAQAAGITHFGENRVQEARRKIPAANARLNAPVTWHMIGHIQSRKARDVAQYFDWVQSLDSLRLAERLSRRAAERPTPLPVLLEINVSGEAQKGGWAAWAWERDTEQRSALWADARAIAALPGLTVRGLMTMAPIVEDMETTRPIFARLRALRAALANDFPAIDWSELSMGMTDDFPVAIEEGATLVRIGRAIFGQRLAQQ